MSQQPPAGDEASGSHSSPGEAHDGLADSTKSNVVPLNPPQHSFGYGRAPIHARFKPGQSGNPKGRPKGSRNAMAECRKVYTAMIVIQVGGKKRRVTRIEALLLRQWELAMKGNQRAAQATMATAKALGVFDETETNECGRANDLLDACLTDEEIRSLSRQGLADFIRIERARIEKRKGTADV